MSIQKKKSLDEWRDLMESINPGPHFGQLEKLKWNNENRTYIFLGCKPNGEKIWEKFDSKLHSDLVAIPSKYSSLEELLISLQ